MSCSSSAEEQNGIPDSVNRMRIEDGKPELTEKEWLTAKKEIRWTLYGKPAASKILESYKAGTVLEHDMFAWY